MPYFDMNMKENLAILLFSYINVSEGKSHFCPVCDSTTVFPNPKTSQRSLYEERLKLRPHLWILRKERRV